MPERSDIAGMPAGFEFDFSVTESTDTVVVLYPCMFLQPFSRWPFVRLSPGLLPVVVAVVCVAALDWRIKPSGRRWRPLLDPAFASMLHSTVLLRTLEAPKKTLKYNNPKRVNLLFAKSPCRQ